MTKPLNRVKCANCGDILVSRHRHDFVQCSCFEDKSDTTGIFIDGGKDYERCGGNLSNVLRYRNRKWVPETFKVRYEDRSIYQIKSIFRNAFNLTPFAILVGFMRKQINKLRR